MYSRTPREQILHVPRRGLPAAASERGERQRTRLGRSEVKMAGERVAGDRERRCVEGDAPRV